MAEATGAVSILMGAAALCGWFFDVQELKSFAPGLPGMRPNTAVVLVLLGLTLVFHRSRIVGVLGPVAVATISTLTLIEYAGPDLAIDDVLFPGDKVGPMPLTGAVAYLLIAGALLLVRLGGSVARTAQPLALAAGALGWLAISGYANGLYQFPGASTPIALNSSIALLAVVVGVLALRPDEGLVKLVTSGMTGGRILRVLGPIAILAPTLLAWLRHLGETNGLYRNEVGEVLLVFVLVLVLLLAVGIAARALERSERARALSEARRLESQSVLDQFFTLSLELLCIAGVDGFFRRINPTWEGTLGWTMKDLTGKPFLDFVHPDDQEATLAALAKLTGGQGLVGFENRYRCTDGSFRWLQWSCSPASGGLIYAVARDVTERIQGVEELRQRTADLAAANEELEAFAYSVSHDLRAPLRGIDGFSQAVLEEYSDKLDETGKDYLVRLRSASQRMGLLIDDILNLSRVSRVEPGHDPVDMSAIATSAAAELRDREPGRQIEFVIEDGVVALGDPRFVSIVFENLFANAFKFTSTLESARIEFGREQVDGEDAYFVKDNGVGFDMAYADQLFVPFHRLHTQTDFPGSGIGLATIRRIVHRHGGRAWAHGEVGRGATVYFTLGGNDERH